MGIIKSTVLNAKRGVITEDRFQKMTLQQWIFHYKEVIKYQDTENEGHLKKFEIEVKILRNEITKVCGHIELMACIINPKAGERYIEHKKLSEAKIDIKEENFAEEWQGLKEMIPQRLLAKDPWQDKSMPLKKKEKKTKPVISFNIKGGD